ncbi:MAG: hypothetical protein NC318_11125 [Blautia sp.]|nr:hypothetical protein [Blautia sp.]
MKEINYWDRFLMTGSVSDFLSYRNAQREAKDGGLQENAGEDESGEHSHAGIYRDDGNDFKG